MAIQLTPELQQELDNTTEEYALVRPFHIETGEAADTADFCEKHFADELSSNGTLLHRGLNSVADPARGLTANTPKEIRMLVTAAQEAASESRTTADKSSNDLPRARFLIDELSAAISWLLDDGVDEAEDTALANLKRLHAAEPDSTDALAVKLADFALFAESLRSRLAKIGGLDLTMIDEAKTMVETLRSRPGAGARLSDKAKEALRLRNRILTLIMKRVAVVRAATKYVYRDRPEVIQKATSKYDRKRRANARKAKTEKAQAEPTTPAVPPTL